ncbi:hypothetical protein PPL_03911 [Heterostelium album PN500]|uniref:Ankyrin repeat-containing protein n=1 Tax=Heterostelium pallidum (strain ATCC 26659 / Pp 5 / PN500) TaxID=670386 RepID=D3B5H3_HETP5|nr:hypothetical protein PPL_03911 [Heterostelium album PN500]EFA83121.1 hypothetical protein PPL_03911 [Heterostelium album PN500]|eukprot:XP_020435238.1 hypothetical protein PPL_03911 [Heterostelium album PN500]
MNKHIFILVFNNYILKRLIFRFISSINSLKAGRYRYKWSEVIIRPCVLIAHNYIDDLKLCLEQRSFENNYDRRGNSSIDSIPKIFKVAMKTKSDLQLIRYLADHYQDELVKQSVDQRSGYMSSSIAFININRIIANAAKFDRFDIIDYLLSRFASFSQWDWYSAMVKAPLSNNFELLKYFVIECNNNGGYDTKQMSNHKKTVLDNAALIGSIEMLEYVIDTRRQDLQQSTMFRYAIQGGRMNVFKYLLKKFKHRLAVERDHLLEVASAHNQFEMAKILMDHGVVANYSIAMANSIRNGNLTMLQWFHDHGDGFKSFLNTESMFYAVINGDFEMVRWIHCNTTIEPTTEMFDTAARLGYLKILRYFHANFPNTNCSYEAFDDAAANGHLDVLEFLNENSNVGCSIQAMNEASRNDRLDVIKWLHNNRSEGCSKKCMDYAARNSNLHIVKWLHQNRTEGCTTDSLDHAIFNEDLEMVKWFYQNRTEGSTYKVEEVIAQGNKELIQFILTKNK